VPFDILFRGDLGTPVLVARRSGASVIVRCLGADVTVKHCPLSSFASASADDPAYWLRKAAKDKNDAFALFVSEGRVKLQELYVFNPWAISTYGNLCPDFLGDLHHLAFLRARCAHRGDASKLNQRVKLETQLLLTYMSYKLQTALFDFMRKRVNACSVA